MIGLYNTKVICFVSGSKWTPI